MSTTASASSSAQAALALAAYRGMWQDMVLAGRTSDYKSPLLARHATGAALTQITASLYRDNQQGLVSRGQPILNPRIGEAIPATNPTRVIVNDCADSRNWLLYKRSGELADNTPGGRRRISADVRAVSGTWTVVSVTVGEIGSC